MIAGFGFQDGKRTFVAQGNGWTWGDRNRNRKFVLLREAVPRDRAVIAIDLGEDKHVSVVMDVECRVLLARKIVKAKAQALGGLLAWAGKRAAKGGLAGLTVALEPTGHQRKALMDLADRAGRGFVCTWRGRLVTTRSGKLITATCTCLRSSWPGWIVTFPSAPMRRGRGRAHRRAAWSRSAARQPWPACRSVGNRHRSTSAIRAGSSTAHRSSLTPSAPALRAGLLFDQLRRAEHELRAVRVLWRPERRWPPAASARRHRFADIRDLLVSGPAPIMSAASRRNRARRASFRNGRRP